MNEQVARNVVLMRAIETADQKHEILTDDDRSYASRSAKELAQWQAADSKSEATAGHFLQQRSELILKKIAERTPSFAKFTKPRSAWLILSMVLPVLALLAGAGLDRITDPHRVDLLSAPLLLVIAWNFVVYLGMLILLVVPTSKFKSWRSRLPAMPKPGKRGYPRKMPVVLTTAVLAFLTEWTTMSVKLTVARVGRTMHLSAALFALGAMLSLYARGFLSQYSAGWESTFLDGRQVHALLSFLFAPAEWVFPLRGFSLADIEALHFPQASLATGGARWVHLYAATLFLLVVAPRLILFGFAQWQARKLTRKFPIDLTHPYFRQFNETLGGAPGVLRILPYSFTIDEARDRGLNSIAAMLLGQRARAMIRPSIAYGDEPKDVLRDTSVNDPAVSITAVLFNLAATPENENHGALLDYLVRESQRGIAVLIDQSSFLERVGFQADGDARVVERIALWRQFCHFHKAPATIVDLIEPDLHPLDAGAGLTLSNVP